MNKLTLCLALALGVALTVSARPEPHHRHASHRRPAVHRSSHRDHHKSSKVKWALNLSPFGSSFSIGTRIGKHGGIALNLPLSRPSVPVVREEKTVIVQQAAPIVQQPAPVVVNNNIQVSPSFVESVAPKTQTWVEGYWKITRSPDGYETSRQWVPGHWE